MLGPSGEDDEVTCVACGESIPRSEAREYDKHGDRWERDGKAFEYLCKPCHDDLCHQRRPGLEGLLIELGAGEESTGEFLARYVEAVEEPESPEER